MHQKLRKAVGKLLFAALAGGAMQLPSAASGAEPRRDACLQGTFVQLVDANKGWTQQQWQELFEQMKQLRIKNIVLQWSVIDGQAFYRSRGFHSTPTPVIEWIMELAEKSGMQVMVGLAHQSDHWTMVGDAKAREKYLGEQLERLARTAGELVPGVHNHRSFAGWYVSEEIDDVNWLDDASNKALSSYLFQATTLLKTITPGARIGISTFTNASTSPEKFEGFWNRMLASVPDLDVIYFQDGIGVHKLGLNKLPAYYGAMERVTKAHKKELRPVIELFEQTGGEPLNDAPFSAVPAPLDRVLQQLTLAGSVGSARQHVVFSVPEYMSSLGGKAAHAAFENYMNFMNSSDLQCGD